MKKLLVASCLVFVALNVQAENISGRFMQDHAGGYRDIRISSNGKSAVWITKNCSKCKEVLSKPEKVETLEDGYIRIGKTEFQVTPDKNGLFHPSLGEWGKEVILAEARH